MSLTRVDCYFYSNSHLEILHHGRMKNCSFSVLNPRRVPGSLVAAGATAARENLGGQVACKLALENFVDGILEYFDNPKGLDQKDEETTISALETAFRKANTTVYSFGHKLAAGGSMAASLMGLVIENNTVSVGRVGFGSSYLCRNGEILPFFDSRVENDIINGRSSFVGSQSLISVELSSIELSEGDILAVFSTFLDKEREDELKVFLENSELIGEVCLQNAQNPCHDLAHYLFPDLVDLSYALLVKIGPDSVYLSEVYTDTPP